MNDILLFFSIKYEGDFYKIMNALEKKEKVDMNELLLIKKKNKDNYVTILDPNYPQMLKHLNNPPFVIYYRGNFSLLNKKGLAFIGSRNHSKYGETMVNKLVTPLTKKYVIISGLAKGIDGLSHKICLENDGDTIAVLGNGLDYYYPYSNKDLQKEIENKGLIISEYPSFVGPKKENFPMRNRIIAAVSKGIIFVEGKKKSGSMITIEYALNLGKEIFCVPSEATKDSGCNYLIKNGAKLVECVNDILEEL